MLPTASKSFNRRAGLCSKDIRATTNASTYSTTASREAYRTIEVPEWQRHYQNWKSNVGCPWLVNDKTTFH
jgi:hypothetical protein